MIIAIAIHIVYIYYYSIRSLHIVRRFYELNIHTHKRMFAGSLATTYIDDGAAAATNSSLRKKR